MAELLPVTLEKRKSNIMVTSRMIPVARNDLQAAGPIFELMMQASA